MSFFDSHENFFSENSLMAFSSLWGVLFVYLPWQFCEQKLHPVIFVRTRICIANSLFAFTVHPCTAFVIYHDNSYISFLNRMDTDRFDLLSVRFSRP